MLKSLRILTTVVLVLGFAQFQATRVAAQSVDFYTHYDVTLKLGATDVTNIMFVETENGLTWPSSTACGGSGCTTVMNNPFGSTNVPTTALLIGLTNGGNDLVLMTNTTFGANEVAVGEDWSTLFPNTNEATFLSDFQLATSGGPFCSHVPLGNPCIDSGLNAVSAFGAGDGAPAFFTIANGSFDVLEFSDGVLIGTGTSSVTSVPPVSAPEGGASLLYLLLAAAFCCAAILINSRKRLTTGTFA